MVLTGAEIVIRCLQEEKVDYLFGYPGGAVLYIYDEIFKQDKVRHVLVRHEQAAIHAADGYARSTDRVGVALVTSGPGATNAVTGIATAYCDSIPMVVISGQVPSAAIGQDAFQEVDTVGITRPCVKHNFLVRDVREIAPTLKKAFYLARTGRPGPVLVDIPKDITAQKCEFVYPASVSMRSYNPVVQVDVRLAALLGMFKIKNNVELEEIAGANAGRAVLDGYGLDPGSGQYQGLRSRDGIALLVGGEHIVGSPRVNHRALFQQQGAVAQLFYVMGKVGDKDDGGTIQGGAQFLEALGLEVGVADGQYLVEDQDIRGQNGGNGKAEADLHARTVALHGRIDEFADFRKVDDFVEFLVDLASLNPEHSGIYIDVLSAGENRTEAGTERDQGANAATDFDAPLVGADESVQQAQQGGLAGTVAANQADAFGPP